MEEGGHIRESLKHLLKRLLPKGEFSRNVIILGGTTAVGQAIGIITTPIVTRLYAPGDFGVMATLGAVAAFLAVLGTFRYEWAIPNPEDDGHAANLLALCLGNLALMTVTTSAVMWVLSGCVNGGPTLETIKPFLWWLPVFMFASGVYNTLSVWAIRKKNFKVIAKTRISQSIGGAIVNVGAGLYGLGALGLLLGGLVSQAAGVGKFISLSWREERHDWAEVHISSLRKTLHRYWRFGLLSTAASLVNTASLQVFTIMLTAYFGTQVVGWYALAQRVVLIPTTIIGNATTQTFWAEAARLINKEPTQLRSLFLRCSKKLLLFSVAIGGVGIISPFVFDFAFGGKSWRMAGVYALYLTPFVVAQFVVGTVSHLSIHERQSWQLGWDLVRLVLLMCCFGLAGARKWSAESMVLLFSVMMSGMYAILFGMNLYALKLKIKAVEKVISKSQ